MSVRIFGDAKILAQIISENFVAAVRENRSAILARVDLCPFRTQANS